MGAMDRVLEDYTEYNQRSSWISSWLPSWCPSSPSHLKNAEDRMLQPIKLQFTRGHVPISNGNYIWTLAFNDNKANSSAQAFRVEDHQVPLVLLHGFGGGVGLWVKNLTALAETGRPVYALDLLGFGRSSRPLADGQAQEAEEQFVQSLEEWREAVGVELMIFLGHNLGGYISAAYALKYPERVKHLVLVEPWGFPARPEDQGVQCRIPIWIKALGTTMNSFNPLALLRLAGPLGPLLLQALSGETAFKNMTIPYNWAQRPMMQRMEMIDPAIRISIICGCRSCIDGQSGRTIEKMRPNSQTDIIVIRGAGHYVFADQSEDFNQVVLKILGNIMDEDELTEGKKKKRKEEVGRVKE